MSLRDDMPESFESIKRNTERNIQDDEQQLIPYTPGYGYRLSFNGNPRWEETERHFFVARHDHIKPPGFLDHDNLNNYQLTVGSWFGPGGYALCYGKISDNSKDNSLASYDNFHVISHSLDEMGDHNAECISQLGEGVRLADWNDITTYYESGGELSDFIIGLKMSIREDMQELFDTERSNLENVNTDVDHLQPPDLLSNQYRVSKDGNLRWQENRHYFIGRHDHLKPFDFLDHDNLNNYQLTLGSWFGQGGFALCYGNRLDIPISLSKALRTTIPIIAYLLVGSILLCATFISMHIQKIPNWLLGRNVDVIRQSIEMKRNEISGLEELMASITKEENGKHTT